MRTRPVLLFAFLFALSGIFAAPSPARSQQKPAPAAPAPLPAQILSARTIFIGNAGSEGDPTIEDFSRFSGSPDRAYDEFYAAVKTLPKYTVVSAPSGADLVFEISFRQLPAVVAEDKGNAAMGAIGQFSLVILDPRTHVTLWTINEYAEGAMLQANRDKNFEQALGRLVADLQALTSATPPAAVPAKK